MYVLGLLLIGALLLVAIVLADFFILKLAGWRKDHNDKPEN